MIDLKEEYMVNLLLLSLLLAAWTTQFCRQSEVVSSTVLMLPGVLWERGEVDE